MNMIEVFRRKKRFFLVFEYLEHTVLEELEARSGGLGFITSRKYIYQVLRALDFIHSHDVSDIRPTKREKKTIRTTEPFSALQIQQNSPARTHTHQLIINYFTGYTPRH